MKIGMASERSGVSQRMIRHYEAVGLLPLPPRRASGYRDYDERDVHRLRFIANARDLGFPIEDIRSLLALWDDPTRSSAEVKRLALARAADIDRKAAVLSAMRDTLLTLVDSCSGDQRADCPIIEALAEGDAR